MAKRKPTASVQLDLPLELPVAPPVERAAPGLWEAVDSFPARLERYHLERRKVLRPKLRQAPLLAVGQGDD
jgi:hypothetical protein